MRTNFLGSLRSHVKEYSPHSNLLFVTCCASGSAGFLLPLTPLPPTCTRLAALCGTSTVFVYLHLVAALLADGYTIQEDMIRVSSFGSMHSSFVYLVFANVGTGADGAHDGSLVG